jgi:hypothetical protein
MDLFGWFRMFKKSKPFELEFGIEKNRSRSLNSESYEPGPQARLHYEEVDRPEFIRRMHEAAMNNLNFYGITPTRIDDQYVLALDCDGLNEMLAACNVIKSYYKWNYVAVKSTASHYWVIVDKVGSISELVAIMRKIPGVDTRYIDYVEKRGYIVLRAMPKDVMPIFPDDEAKFTNNLARTWFREFKQHWQSEDTAHYLTLKTLQTAILTKSVITLAANPNFVI